MYRSALRNRFLVTIFAVFSIFLIATFFAWKITSNIAQQESKDRFYQSSLAVQNWAQEKINLYILAIEVVSGFTEINDTVKRDEWSSYIKRIGLIEKNPGISSINYVEKVSRKDMAAFVKSVQQDTTLNPAGYPDFKIFPDLDKDEFFVVKYTEPVEGREKSLGFDIGSEGERLGSLEKARDSGEAVSTGKIILTTTQKPGFGILVPVYNSKTDFGNPDERKTNIKGFVYAIFRGEDMFRAIYGENDPFPELDFEIYDSEKLSEENLLYDRDSSHKISESRLMAKETLAVGAQKWIILISAKNQFLLTKSQQVLPLVVLVSGLSFSFIFLGLFLYRFKQHLANH